jgi:hypothetical protein
MVGCAAYKIPSIFRITAALPEKPRVAIDHKEILWCLSAFFFGMSIQTLIIK